MLEALKAAPQPLRPGSPLVAMVSGGSDSTALLLRCAQGKVDLMDGRGARELPRQDLCVLHVNHCLRGAESDGDEAFVRGLCARLGVQVRVARVDVAALVAQGANLEEAAREVRYRLAWQLACELAQERGLPAESARVLVAHTADDRAETFLMRALAGSGLAGLVGMRPVCGIVVRPLIGCTRAELRSELRDAGVGWREDSTNAGDEAARSYVRHHVVPPMVARNPSFAKTLGRSLDVLQAEEDLLARLARQAFEALVRPARPGWCVLDAAGLAEAEPALAPRCALLALEAALGEEAAREARFEQGHLARVAALARSGRGSCSLPGGVQVRVEGVELVFRGPAAPAAPADAALAVPGRLEWGGAVLEAAVVGLQGRPAREVACERAGALAARGLVQGRDFVLVDACVAGVAGPVGTGALEVGSPHAGERMEPFGLGAAKLLSDVLPQAGVPARDRPWTPVVRGAAGSPHAGRCVWVGGIRLDQRAAWSDKTACLIQLSLVRP